MIRSSPRFDNKEQPYSKDFNGDFQKMSPDAMKRQWETGRKCVSRKQRKLKQGTAENAYSLRDLSDD